MRHGAHTRPRSFLHLIAALLILGSWPGPAAAAADEEATPRLRPVPLELPASEGAGLHNMSLEKLRALRETEGRQQEIPAATSARSDSTASRLEEQLTPQPQARDLELWSEIEGAARAGNWDQVKTLVQHLPDWRSSRAVEQLLSRAPRKMPKLRITDSVGLEEQRLITREMISRNDAHDAEVRLLHSGPPKHVQSAPHQSTKQRPSRPTTAHRPPTKNGGGNTPAAVLTVGAGCTHATIQAAIDAANSGDTLWIQGTTFNESLDIDGKDLILWGGYDASCTMIDGSRTTVDGSSAADSVLEIFGTMAQTVEVHRLDLTGGSDDADYGGGLEISGASHVVDLYEVDIYNNVSSFGGGVHMTDGAILRLRQSSRIACNTALSDGGGIFALGPFTSINIDSAAVGSPICGGNTALNGGGIYLSDASLFVGAFDLNGAVQLNQAGNGGGIYAAGSSSVNLDGAQSVVSSNIATAAGGGIYLADGASFWNNSGGILNNAAGSHGGGIFASTTGTIDADGDWCDTALCSRFIGNQTTAGGWGGAISSWEAAVIDLESTTIHGNSVTGFSSALTITNPLAVTLKSVVITENSGPSNSGTITLDTAFGMVMHNCTLADNSGNYALYPLISVFTGSLTAQGLIVWGDDGFILSDDFGYGGLFTISESIDQFGVGGPSVDPLFFDAANDDYHIRPDSPAVDIATGSHLNDIDLEIRPLGAGFDAGADEAYSRVGLNGAPCAYPSISAAISAAFAGDTIYISPGLYPERPGTIDKDLVLTTSNGDCTAEDSAADPGATIIDGSSTADVFGGVLDVTNLATVDLRHLSLSSGTATYGGNLYVNLGATVNLENAYLVYGTADTAGGGARVLGTLNLYDHSVITLNQAGAGSGAGYGGGVSVTGPGAALHLHDGSWLGSAGSGNGNHATTAGGGAMVVGGATMTMNDSSIIFNNTVSGSVLGSVGGGVAITGPGSTLTVDAGATIGENAADGDGGGINVSDGAGVLVDGGVVALNQASEGGGIHLGDAITNPVSLSLSNDALVLGNHSEGAGGGVWIQDADSASIITLDGTDISYNSAVDYAGGLGIFGATLNVSDAVISNNTAASAGGIFGYGQVNVDAINGPVLITNNQALAGDGGGILDASFNLLHLWALGPYPIIIDTNSASDNGGGIRLAQTDCEIRGDVQITNNTAGVHGGGIFQADFATTINEDNGRRPLITNNQATTGNGGGIYAIDVAGGLSLLDAVIDSNSAPGGSGGGIYAEASNLTMSNTLVLNNSAAVYGGGVALEDGSSITIDAVQVAPTAPGSGADAPRLSNCDPSVLPADSYCSEFRNNSSTSWGGGLYLGNTGAANTANISSTAFIGGSASYGPALYSRADGDVINLTNIRFSENSGIHTVATSGASTLTMHSCTIAGNSHSVGVANAAASAYFYNSIIWGNNNDSAINPPVSSSCNISQGGSPGLPWDPVFTTTSRGAYHLDASSPAIDPCGEGPTYDLDNNPRPTGLMRDMGAFEASAGTFTGDVELQPERASIAGVTVAAFEAGTSILVASTTTAANGEFTLPVDSGTYDVVADIDLYLSASYRNITMTAGLTLQLPTVTLHGGDTDDNGTVALLDVTYVASRFGSTTEPLADINASGAVDLVDITATAANFGTSQPTPWP